MKWFKFYGQDWLTDLKIINMRMEDRLCFITLLSLASSANEGGLIKNCDEESIIRLSNIPNDPTNEHNPYERAKGFLDRCNALQIVTLSGNGDVTVNNFSRRQEENLSNAEKQKRYRERLKTTTNSSNDRYVTPSNNRYPRIDKNRIDKKGEETPSQESIKFFDGEDIYNLLLEEFSKDNNRPFIEKEFKKFILYWTEKNKTGTKQKWQLQSTFEVKRRLYNWLSKSNDFTKPKTKIAFL